MTKLKKLKKNNRKDNNITKWEEHYKIQKRIRNMTQEFRAFKTIILNNER